MKLNLDNFYRSCEGNVDKIFYIVDDDCIVRSTYFSLCAIPHRYHTVKWWFIFNKNNKNYMLIYLENPKKKYDAKEFFRRKTFFRDMCQFLLEDPTL